MARGPTLTGVAVLAILLILAGFLIKELGGRRASDARIRAPAAEAVRPGPPG